MMTDTPDDDTIVVSSETGEIAPVPVEAPSVETDDSDDGNTITSSTPDAEDNEVEMSTNDVLYDEDTVDFRGEPTEKIINLLRTRERELGKALDTRVLTIGTWENLLYRAINDVGGMDEDRNEEIRIQTALSCLSAEERAGLSDRLRDSDGKTILRTSSLRENVSSGETKVVSGDAALMAFELQEKGGVYRVPLYNSGITIDVIVPTGNDVQTLLRNCIHADKQLGSSNGAHYFTYNDLVYKGMILNFLQPLIRNSSYSDWKKKGKLWSIIKLPDLANIVATLAALMYKDGFEGFVVKCTRPKTEDHPALCGHTETITANVFNMIVTRFPVLSKDAVDFMTAARFGNGKHNVNQISKYQADLGFEGEKISFGDITFTMRIPSLTEHTEAGQKFIADVINEVEADNTEGLYEAFGLRYIRTFLPWIGMVEKASADGGSLQTDEPQVIIRELEKLSDRSEDDKIITTLRNFVNKTQLTYVGYPVTQCTQCHYMADTPSGMWTFDPFAAFFTLALQYMKPKASTPTKA